MIRASVRSAPSPASGVTTPGIARVPQRGTHRYLLGLPRLADARHRARSACAVARRVTHLTGTPGARTVHQSWARDGLPAHVTR